MIKKVTLIKIIGGRLITGDRILANGSLLIKEGRIAAIAPGDIEAPEALVIDARENYISPGFIDLHVHGGAGHDFMDNTVDAFLQIAKMHASCGTRAMLPTTLTGPTEEII